MYAEFVASETLTYNLFVDDIPVMSQVALLVVYADE